MEKRRNNFFTFFITTATFVLAGLVILSSIRVSRKAEISSDFAAEAKSEDEVKEETVNILSPDGKYTLTVKNVMQSSGLVTQTFYPSSEADKSPVKVFEKDSNPDKPVSIPYNTFSPDDKFIFLKHEEAGKMR